MNRQNNQNYRQKNLKFLIFRSLQFPTRRTIFGVSKVRDIKFRRKKSNFSSENSFVGEKPKTKVYSKILQQKNFKISLNF